jgi:hypothetical protein
MAGDTLQPLPEEGSDRQIQDLRVVRQAEAVTSDAHPPGNAARPQHLGLHPERPYTGPDLYRQRGSRWETRGELHAESAATHVGGMAAPRSGGASGQAPASDREPYGESRVSSALGGGAALRP